MIESEYSEGCDHRGAQNYVIERIRWTQKPFYRQVFVASCMWASCFQAGLSAGAPPVMTAQLRRESNRTEAFDDDAASWFNSASGFSGAVFVVLMALLSEYLGRRLSYLLTCVTTLTSFIIFYCATSYRLLILSQVLLGPLFGGSSNVAYMIFSEYISPKYRGVFLTIKSATVYWAIWVANTVGTFLHWRNIAILGIVCAVYNTSLVFFWPESPYWLARKGRMRETREAHKWLRGTDESAQKELECLINSEMNRSKRSKEDTKFNTRVKVWLKKLVVPEFYKPMLLCGLLVITYYISGKLVLTIYSLDIIKKITNNKAAAYTQMLVLDGITVLGMYFGCGASRYLKRRTLLFITQIIAIAFLFSISLYLYLIKLGFISETVYLSIFFLLGFSLSISCGAMILMLTLVAELLPLELRSFAAVLENTMSNSVRGVTLKFAPLTFATFGLHGGFLTFAVGSVVCALLLFKYLPETKDKTLKEIESLFKNKEEIDLKEEKELVPMTTPEFVKNEKPID